MHKHTPTAGIERATTRLQQKQDRDAAPVRGCARSSVPSVGTTTTMARCSPPKKTKERTVVFVSSIEITVSVSGSFACDACRNSSARSGDTLVHDSFRSTVKECLVCFLVWYSFAVVPRFVPLSFRGIPRYSPVRFRWVLPFSSIAFRFIVSFSLSLFDLFPFLHRSAMEVFVFVGCGCVSRTPSFYSVHCFVLARQSEAKRTSQTSTLWSRGATTPSSLTPTGGATCGGCGTCCCCCCGSMAGGGGWEAAATAAAEATAWARVG